MSEFRQWLALSGSTPRGIVCMHESPTTGPAALALFGGLATSPTSSPQPVYQKTWFDAHATSRHGGSAPHDAAAYDGKDTATYRALVAEWQCNVVTLDQLLGIETHFMIGPWLAQATAHGRAA
ncbi:MAG: hypothetical protein FWE75_10105, partial [Actinomycetia bacterium]|nr:hypothetical protein [Actinomycetes bacterium]